MARQPSIYLAGPEVFLPEAVAVGRGKKALCAEHGFAGLYPFDNEVPAGSSRADGAIYAANIAMMRQADLGIFNLTPFRGPGADTGTVFELGMMIGLGKPVFGYTHDPLDLLGRLRAAGLARQDSATGAWLDRNGMTIENFGNADNLMIDAALAAQGHKLVRVTVDPDALFSDLTGFKLCLKAARREMHGKAGISPGSRPRPVFPETTA